MLRVIGDLVSTLFEDLREEHLSVYLICHFDHIACVTDQSHTAEDVVEEDRCANFYQIPNIAEYEDVCLQTLRENCLMLEERLRDILEKLSDDDRQVMESYLDLRNELEFQSLKTALRWGKQHYM